MKKSLILIAVAMVAALTVVSCKNNRKAQVQEPTQEEIQEMKLALADSVMAIADELAEQYIDKTANSIILKNFELTEEEKLIKPDYLLEPSLVNTFVTNSQKINALAIYSLEMEIRQIYDMPTKETKDAIAKLVLETNFSLGADFSKEDLTASDVLREYYKNCKNRDKLYEFWQYANAELREIDYLLAKNPDLYIRQISEQTLKVSVERWFDFYKSIKMLAPYDKEIGVIYDTNYKNEMSDIEMASYYSDIETMINTYKSNIFNFIEKRNAILQ